MDAALTYVSYFESVQLLTTFGIGAVIMAVITTRHLRKKQVMQFAHEQEERRFKLLEMDKRPKLDPPSSRND